MCECGCGETAPITRGRQRRFVQGHNSRVFSNFALREQDASRNKMWRGEGATSNGVHTWLRKNYPKAGKCERCYRIGKTDYAFLRHPAPHTRDLADYAELCRSCHIRFDRGLL